MFKALILSLVVAMVVLASGFLSSEAGRGGNRPCEVIVTHQIYSGRPSPGWSVWNQEAIGELRQILDSLAQTEAQEAYNTFDLGSFTIEDRQACLKAPAAFLIWVDEALIKVEYADNHSLYYRDPDRRVTRWLKQSAPADGAGE